MSDEVSVAELKRMLFEQKATIENLEKKVIQAQRQADAAEQYTRQDCLILRGKLDIRPNHSFREEVIKIIEFHTGIKVPMWCLNTAHWISKNKSIIVRFNDKEIRDSIYRNRIAKTDDKKGLFIHESLTSSRMKVMKHCISLRKDKQIGSYYTHNGNIYVKKNKDAVPIPVTPDMNQDDIIHALRMQPDSFREAATRTRQEVQRTGETDGTEPVPRVREHDEVTPHVVNSETDHILDQQQTVGDSITHQVQPTGKSNFTSAQQMSQRSGEDNKDSDSVELVETDVKKPYTEGEVNTALKTPHTEGNVDTAVKTPYTEDGGACVLNNSNPNVEEQHVNIHEEPDKATPPSPRDVDKDRSPKGSPSSDTTSPNGAKNLRKNKKRRGKAR